MTDTTKFDFNSIEMPLPLTSAEAFEVAGVIRALTANGALNTPQAWAAYDKRNALPAVQEFADKWLLRLIRTTTEILSRKSPLQDFPRFEALRDTLIMAEPMRYGIPHLQAALRSYGEEYANLMEAYSRQ